MKKRVPRRKLRNFIEDRGIKKGEIADSLGISRQRFSYILNGRKRTLLTCCMEDICGLLQCKPEKVFSKKECEYFHYIKSIEKTHGKLGI